MQRGFRRSDLLESLHFDRRTVLASFGGGLLGPLLVATLQMTVTFWGHHVTLLQPLFF